jgi:hypothetical protein
MESRLRTTGPEPAFVLIMGCSFGRQHGKIEKSVIYYYNICENDLWTMDSIPMAYIYKNTRCSLYFG